MAHKPGSRAAIKVLAATRNLHSRQALHSCRFGAAIKKMPLLFYEYGFLYIMGNIIKCCINVTAMVKFFALTNSSEFFPARRNAQKPFYKGRFCMNPGVLPAHGKHFA